MEKVQKSSNSEQMQYVPPKQQLPFNKLHGVISQKTELFKTNALETSYPIHRKIFKQGL
jgi:hypothetical protein